MSFVNQQRTRRRWQPPFNSSISPQRTSTERCHYIDVGQKPMNKIFQIGLVAAVFIQISTAEETDAKYARFLNLEAAEYHWRYIEAIDAGKLDLPENTIPDDISSDARARAYYNAGFLRGVREYRIESELKNSNSQRPCIPPHGVFRWELEGFIKGCAVARVVGSAIQKDIQDVLVRELQKDNSTPDSAIEAALRVIGQQWDDRVRRDEQTGAGQPAPKSVEKIPVEVQPLPPPSEDAPK